MNQINCNIIIHLIKNKIVGKHLQKQGSNNLEFSSFLESVKINEFLRNRTADSETNVEHTPLKHVYSSKENSKNHST